jgi:hypothetical protein
MTTITDFTLEEQALLSKAPFNLGIAMAMSSGSGLGTIKEAAKVAQATIEGRAAFPTCALIGSLISALETQVKESRDDLQEMLKPDPGAKSPEDLANLALSGASKAVAAVTAKASAQEAGEYKQWLMQIAQKVAGAATEGGFLGIGGQQYSDPEKAMLQRVATALGVTYTPPA